MLVNDSIRSSSSNRQSEPKEFGSSGDIVTVPSAFMASVVPRVALCCRLSPGSVGVGRWGESLTGRGIDLRCFAGTCRRA